MKNLGNIEKKQFQFCKGDLYQVSYVLEYYQRSSEYFYLMIIL